MRYETALFTDPGSRPVTQNFASHVVAPSGENCWILADGLGGGERAARIAVEVVAE